MAKQKFRFDKVIPDGEDTGHDIFFNVYLCGRGVDELVGDLQFMPSEKEWVFTAMGIPSWGCALMGNLAEYMQTLPEDGDVPE